MEQVIIEKIIEGNELTPREIVERLDEHIIGQTNAKKAVAIALRNRTRRRKLEPELREEIYPKNIIMIGPTGVGKTEIARRLSKLCGAPFLKVEATKYTEVGYVGRDVESMIRDIAMISLNMVKTEYRENVMEKAKENAEEIILDLLLPGNSYDKNKESRDIASSPFPESINPQLEPERAEHFKESREIFRKKLQEGKLDDKEIEVDAHSGSSGIPMFQVLGGSNLEDIDQQLQGMFGDMMNKKDRKKKMRIADAIVFIAEQEAEKLIDQEKIQKEALQRVEEMGIIFLDEIDKIAGREGRTGADVSREGVQRDLLPIVEGATVNTKIGSVKTDHILFIAAGAFNMSKPSDLIPELQGRFPIRVELDKLTMDDFVKILTAPKTSLTKQYEALLGTEEIKINFTPDGVSEIAGLAFLMNEKNENIGARRLNTMMEKLLEDISFNGPDLKVEEKNIVINSDFVKDKLIGIVKDKDLSQYIL